MPLNLAARCDSSLSPHGPSSRLIAGGSANLRRGFSSRACSSATFGVLHRRRGRETEAACVELAATRVSLEAGGGLCSRRAVEGGGRSQAVACRRRYISGLLEAVGFRGPVDGGSQGFGCGRRGRAVGGRFRAGAGVLQS